MGRTHRNHHSISQWGILRHREVRGQGRPVFRTTVWMARDISMFLESQMVLEEQGGLGNSEKRTFQ